MVLRLIAIAAVLMVSLPAQADITQGEWLRGDGNARIKISPCGSALCAVNLWIKNPADGKAGDRLVLDVKPRGEGRLEGTGFDPQRNLRFNGFIEYSGSRMTARGCMIGSLLCKTTSWNRQ